MKCVAQRSDVAAIDGIGEVGEERRIAGHQARSQQQLFELAVLEGQQHNAIDAAPDLFAKTVIEFLLRK